MTTSNPTYGQVDRSYGMRLATTPAEDDGPVWMVNLMHYHDQAQYADGNPGGVSGRDADDRYAPVKVLTEIGAEVVFHGDVDVQLLGDAPAWDRVGVVKYPTRRSFIEMQSRPDFQDKHVHKQAGMASTIVMGCQPADVVLPADLVAAARDWAEVEHPPTQEDGPVMVIHVIKFADDRGSTTMVDYQTKATVAAGRHGARVAGWFDVEGTIIGDDRHLHDDRATDDQPLVAEVSVGPLIGLALTDGGLSCIPTVHVTTSCRFS